ncbi:pyrimidine 5'-nucleotidase [Sphingomonas sp. RS2018]
MRTDLAHIDAWIFDLDNTLYPASSNLFVEVEQRMTTYIETLTGLSRAEAGVLRERWFHEHGTTVAGLVANHDVDARAFLEHVHDVEMDVLEHNAPLAALVARLPGRKLVFTNGDLPYAQRVLGRLGLGDSFEGIHDIHAMHMLPKPAPSAYAGLCAAHDIAPARAFFADDMIRNLAPAKAIGMTTLWIDGGTAQGGHERGGHGAGDFIDYTTADLTGWLADLLGDAP